MEQPIQITIFDYLESISNDEDVKIVNAINPKKSLKPLEVSMAYGDLVLLVAMCRDYVAGLDKVKADDVLWQAYYRNKFLKMADRISEQIGYDYDKAKEQCLKKVEKESDIGEEALILAVGKGK